MGANVERKQQKKRTLLISHEILYRGLSSPTSPKIFSRATFFIVFIVYSYCAVSWVCQLYILMKCISFLLFSLSPLRVFCARPTGLGCDMLCALYMDDSKCVATLKLESAVNCLATIAVAIAIAYPTTFASSTPPTSTALPPHPTLGKEPPV